MTFLDRARDELAKQVFDPHVLGPDCEQYKQHWLRHAAPDYVAAGGYLEYHFHRFVRTKQLVESSGRREPRPALLDVGALGLVQSVLYAADGYRVTAIELDTWHDFRAANIQSLASEFGIQLVTYRDLQDLSDLRALPDSSFQIVLFTEVLEHITFNPVNMWKELYRLLAPGGRIIVTTPSYYYVGFEPWGWTEDLRRIARGLGAGVAAHDVVHTTTMGHHWRLYSARDIREYFRALSPDFEVTRIAYFNYKPNQPERRWRDVARGALQRVVPPFRESIFAEVLLREKDKGVQVAPHW